MNITDFWNPYCRTVSLTFDDGMENQLEKAVQALDRWGIEATCYIHP